MKKVNKMMLVMVAFCAMAMPIQAQSFIEQVLGSVLQGAAAGIEVTTLKKVVNTPSMQSQEMKNFLACYRQGGSEESTGNYYDAAQSYAKAWQKPVSDK